MHPSSKLPPISGHLSAGYVYTDAKTSKQVCCKWNEYGYTDDNGNPGCCPYGECSKLLPRMALMHQNAHVSALVQP